MRIAIPLDENKQDICIVFSRAPYFLLRDFKIRQRGILPTLHFFLFQVFEKALI